MPGSPLAVGGTAPDFATPLGGMPLSPVTLIPVVLITAGELDYVRADGRAAREDLVSVCSPPVWAIAVICCVPAWCKLALW